MAEAIKDFFKKKKLDAKFKIAGSGHRLDESSSSSSTSEVNVSNVSNVFNQRKDDKKDLSTQKAAEAAIERIQRQQMTHSNKTNTLENILQEERQKISEEYKMKDKVECLVKDSEKIEKRYEEFESQQKFICPTIGDNQSFPLNELSDKIYDYIQNNFTEDLTLMSILTIINCNYNQKEDNKLKIEECIKTLDKIITNMRDSSPEDIEKFKKIRKSKIEKRVLELKGGLEFLLSIGFELDSEEEWLLFNAEFPNISEQMSYYKDVLNNAKPFPILLDRNCIVLDPNTRLEDLSTDFFNLSTAELKREMHSLTQKRELEETLRTKAMREIKTKKCNLKYSRLRFKFADGLQIEATFKTSETLYDIKVWLLQNSENIKEFDLKCGHQVFTDQQLSKTLQELELVPAAALLIITKNE